MARCRVDKSIERHEIKGFAFPLGVYPVEDVTPRAGYTCWFEPADGGSEGSAEEPGEESGPFATGSDEDEGDEGRARPGAGGAGEFEEWPDRYAFDIAIPATRLEALSRALFAALPGRIYPLLDFLGHDAYREVDSYVSYELIGQERFIDALRRFRSFFFEDGLVGFGAMSDEPFMSIFVDEHKIITVRVQTSLKETIESILAAFDLEEVDEIAGADAVTHEHRGVLDAPTDRPDLLAAEEIIEDLIDEWDLVLNVDPNVNVDAEGNALGITGWRCVVRFDPVIVIADPDAGSPPKEASAGRSSKPAAAGSSSGGEPGRRGPRYAEVLVTASSLARADEQAVEAARAMLADSEQDDVEEFIVAADRLTPDDFRALVNEVRTGATTTKNRTAAPAEVDLTAERVLNTRWLE